MSSSSTTHVNTKKIALAALFTAASLVLSFIQIPIFPAAPFLACSRTRTGLGGGRAGFRSDCFAGTQHAAASSSHGRICRADIFMVCAPKLAFRTIKSKNRTIFAVPNRRARFLPSFGMPRGAGRGKNAQRCGGPLRNAAVHRRLRPAPAVPHLPAAEGSAPRADTVQP